MATPDASQNRPASPQQAPDPATSYERAKPEKEAGQGSLDSPIGGATPEDRSDRQDETVRNAHAPRQINADDALQGVNSDGRRSEQSDLAGRPVKQPDHSMHDEEPDGWDQAPTDLKDPRHQRHPRVGGKGGTPDAGDSHRRG